MKKDYDSPKIEIITFSTPDVITASGGTLISKAKTPSININPFQFMD